MGNYPDQRSSDNNTDHDHEPDFFDHNDKNSEAAPCAALRGSPRMFMLAKAGTEREPIPSFFREVKAILMRKVPKIHYVDR